MFLEHFKLRTQPFIEHRLDYLVNRMSHLVRQVYYQ